MNEVRNAFPMKCDVHTTYPDFGDYEVYFAEDVDKWLEKLEKFLKEQAYDQQTVQHGNVALRILRLFFFRPLRDSALDRELSGKAEVDGEI